MNGLSTDVSGLSGATADIAAVTQVVLYEREARDRGWWGQMRATYWPEAEVNLMWHQGSASDFIARSAALFDAGARPLHHMYSPVVHVSGARAHVEAPTVTWTTWDIDGTSGNLNTHMRLNYQLERRGVEWRIVRFDCVYEYATLTPAVPGESIVVPADELAGFRSSYAILGWHQVRRGVAVDGDQLGADRPEQLDEFYASTRDWLHD